MSRFAAALIGAVALLALGGCQPGVPEIDPNDQVAAADRIVDAPEGEGEAPAAPEGPTIEFVGAATIAWDAVPDSAPTGPVTVSLVCEGLPHNVVFEGLFGDDPVTECQGPGTVTSDPVELPAGELTYYCSIPGHRSAMEGTLTVQ
jgi:Copper binding proteins, plastocyanin/azurin family